ncbi:hypothetical protein CPS_3908 [Colwellia psychrerythraea 34H]|uniref:Uncharacterized protein n=1 Tax=Colwellia psychrerythraea (strain 34H / ATCC BAA-681) TaxID=167879 RepID=Q47XA4_COLP3|nr:hypothetical protein CPS_3908 [Colwellia psychrerythraea 34H]
MYIYYTFFIFIDKASMKNSESLLQAIIMPLLQNC